MDMKLKVAEYIAAAAKCCFENCGLGCEDICAMIETPPDKKMGDYALPCFRLSKVMRCAPQMIAGKLAEKVACEEIDHVEVVGGYLNVFLRRGGLARDIVEAVLAHPGRWGSSEIGKGKTVCLDYSSINIAKRFHIGHLSTTMIGNSLKRIYDFNGYTTVGINHLGDWGTQFGKMICAYKKWGNREEVEKGGVQAMVDLYVRFHHEAEQHPELEDEGRAWFKKIEDGDKEAMEIFTWFKEVTLKDTQRVYDLLGVSFDSYAGESFYNDKMAPVVEELKEKGLLVKLDTNGCFPDRLEKILDAHLVDYVAMDWKNDPDHYALTAGVEESPLAAVTRSLEALLSGTVPFELRTTVVEQLHSKQSFEQIRDYLLPLTGKNGKKIPAFYLQAFKDRDTVPFAGLTAPDKKALEQYGALLEPIADTVRLRGV